MAKVGLTVNHMFFKFIHETEKGKDYLPFLKKYCNEACIYIIQR